MMAASVMSARRTEDAPVPGIPGGSQPHVLPVPPRLDPRSMGGVATPRGRDCADMTTTFEDGTRRVTLFGVPTDALTMDETVEVARQFVRSNEPHQHVVLNAAKVVELRRDHHLRDVIRRCDLISADGTSILWASRLLGHQLPERVTGIDLFLRLVETAHRDGDSVYFLGARQDIVTRASSRSSATATPGFQVAGFGNGYWSDDREVHRARCVNSASRDYLFLAMPSPTKEFWLGEHLAELGVPFVMGVGGSFDVVAGKVTRAPRWMQQAGLEWASARPPGAEAVVEALSLRKPCLHETHRRRLSTFPRPAAGRLASGEPQDGLRGHSAGAGTVVVWRRPNPDPALRPRRPASRPLSTPPRPGTGRHGSSSWTPSDRWSMPWRGATVSALPMSLMWHRPPG